MDAAGQLDLYNRALSEHLGEKTLASLTEVRKARFLLDDVWARDPIKSALEDGQWTFGNRTLRIDASLTIEPEFGFDNAFEKPTDWLITTAISADPYFNNTLDAYSDEAGIIYAPMQTIYLKYVSNDANYGQNDALWPEYFRNYVAGKMALRICEPLTQSEAKIQRIEQTMEKILMNAQGKDNRNRPTTYPSEGTWARARRGTWGGRRGGCGPYG
jgi:hypothetical protein